MDLFPPPRPASACALPVHAQTANIIAEHLKKEAEQATKVADALGDREARLYCQERMRSWAKLLLLLAPLE